MQQMDDTWFSESPIGADVSNDIPTHEIERTERFLPKVGLAILMPPETGFNAIKILMLCGFY